MENVKNNFEELKKLLTGALEILEQTNLGLVERIEVLEKNVENLENRVEELLQNAVQVEQVLNFSDEEDGAEAEAEAEKAEAEAAEEEEATGEVVTATAEIVTATAEIVAATAEAATAEIVTATAEIVAATAEAVTAEAATAEAATADVEEIAEYTAEELAEELDEEPVEVIAAVPEEVFVADPAEILADDISSDAAELFDEAEFDAEVETEIEPEAESVGTIMINDFVADEQKRIVNEAAKPDWYDWEVDYPAEYVDDVYKGISFNDRYEFIKELFNVTGSLDEAEMAFKETLDTINNLEHFKQVVTYIRERFPQWDEQSDEVYRFYMAVRRKFNK